MGIAKKQMIEDEDRGWGVSGDDYVCADCVEDAYLAKVIRENVNVKECTFCGRSANVDIAAPLETLMEPIAGAVFYHFSEPTQAGVPWDGGFVIDSTDTQDVLYTLGLECETKLFDAIADSFVNDSWVPSADGHWATSHNSEVLRYSWRSFVSTVKHHIRFHFHLPSEAEIDPQEIEASAMLPMLCRQIEQCGLVRELEAGLELVRVRTRKRTEVWDLDAQQLGAPPPEFASAGRMNPAGIPYLYLALDEATAIAETRPKRSEHMVVGTFRTTRPLRVVDFTQLPEVPSVFDPEMTDVRQGLLFLQSFVKDISKPIKRDWLEHLDYVPTQVVCEYLAYVFKPGGLDERVDGVLYASAVHDQGTNLVLFPSSRGWEGVAFEAVTFISAREIKARSRSRLPNK